MKTKDIYDTTTDDPQLKDKAITIGKVMVTPGLQENVEREEFVEALGRHENRDWGEVGAEDWEANEQALIHGNRLFSVYVSQSTGTRMAGIFIVSLRAI